MMNREELDRPDDFNVETMRIGGDTVLLALEGQVDCTRPLSFATSWFRRSRTAP